MTETKLFYSAAEVAKLLGISVGQSYRLMRGWNKELEARHYLVIAGKIPVQYFNEQIYGGVGAQKIAVPDADNTEIGNEVVANG